MSRCKPVRRCSEGETVGYRINCPGCKGAHVLYTNMPGHPNWSFDESLDLPTFSPSLLVRTGHYIEGHAKPPNCLYCNSAASDGHESHCGVCHSFIRDGRIQFLSDCTHELAGQTVDLPEVVPWKGEND